MKRLPIALLVIMSIVLLCSCSGSMSEAGTWKLQDVSDKDGNIIAYGPDYTGTDASKLDLSYSFDNEKFEVTNAGQLIASGTYEKVSSDKSISLTLDYGNGSTASGVLEEKAKDGGTAALTLTITTDQNTFTFLKTK